MQDYSSASDGNDLFAGIIRNASGANRTTNAVKFFVRVLTDPIPIDADHAKQVLNAGFIEPNFEIKEEKGFGFKKNQAIRASENPQNVRLMFRGRIVKSNNGLMPHIFIRDPCKISITRDRAFAYKLIAKHTLFISKKSFFGTTPKLGDLVEVTLERSDFKGPNLQVAFFDEIVDQQQSEIYNFEKRKECTSLKQIMDRADFGDGGAVAPGTSVAAFGSCDGGYTGPSTTPVTAQTRTPAEINNAYPQIAAVSGWAEKIIQVSKDLGIPDPAWLANVMYYETAKTLNPGIINSIGCTGLIQFCPTTGAKTVGKTTTELAAMDPITQMDFVKLYLEKSNPKRIYNAPVDLYMTIFYPAAINKPKCRLPNWAINANNGISSPEEYAQRADAAAKIKTGD